MSKHTPGPWNVDTTMMKTAIPIRHQRQRDNPQSHTVAYVGTPGNKSTGQTKADARLIAAAPDLLEACKAAAEKLRHSMDTRDCTNCSKVVALVEAAIAKAEGGTHE